MFSLQILTPALQKVNGEAAHISHVSRGTPHAGGRAKEQQSESQTADSQEIKTSSSAITGPVNSSDSMATTPVLTNAIPMAISSPQDLSKGRGDTSTKPSPYTSAKGNSSKRISSYSWKSNIRNYWDGPLSQTQASSSSQDGSSFAQSPAAAAPAADTSRSSQTGDISTNTLDNEPRQARRSVRECTPITGTNSVEYSSTDSASSMGPSTRPTSVDTKSSIEIPSISPDLPLSAQNESSQTASPIEDIEKNLVANKGPTNESFYSHPRSNSSLITTSTPDSPTHHPSSPPETGPAGIVSLAENGILPQNPSPPSAHPSQDHLNSLSSSCDTSSSPRGVVPDTMIEAGSLLPGLSPQTHHQYGDQRDSAESTLLHEFDKDIQSLFGDDIPVVTQRDSALDIHLLKNDPVSKIPRAFQDILDEAETVPMVESDSSDDKVDYKDSDFYDASDIRPSPRSLSVANPVTPKSPKSPASISRQKASGSPTYDSEGFSFFRKLTGMRNNNESRRSFSTANSTSSSTAGESIEESPKVLRDMITADTSPTTLSHLPPQYHMGNLHMIDTDNASVISQPYTIDDDQCSIMTADARSVMTSDQQSFSTVTAVGDQRPRRQHSRLGSGFDHKRIKDRLSFRPKNGSNAHGFRLSSLLGSSTSNNEPKHKASIVNLTNADLGDGKRVSSGFSGLTPIKTNQSTVTRPRSRDFALDKYSSFFLAKPARKRSSVPDAPERMPSWLLKGVIASKSDPRGVFISDHIYLVPSLWDTEIPGVEQLGKRLAVIDRFAKFGLDYCNGIGSDDIKPVLDGFENDFNDAFITSLSEKPKQAQGQQHNTAAYSPNSRSPRLSTSGAKNSRRSSLLSAKPVIAQDVSSVSSNGTMTTVRESSSTIFKKFKRKGSLMEMTGFTSSTSKDNSDAISIRSFASSVTKSMPSNLHDYLSVVSTLAEAVDQLEQMVYDTNQLVGSNDVKSKSHLHVFWFSQYRRFCGRVVCRLLVKDILTIQELHRDDFRNFLLT